jgi:putative ABC transport system permease protein
LAAVLFGVAAGSVAAWRIAVDLMALPFHWQIGPGATAALIALMITIAFGLIGTWPALGRKPAAVLRNL